MKKIFSLVVTISILGGVAAPSFAQKRKQRYQPPLGSTLGGAVGRTFPSNPSRIGVGAAVGVGGCKSPNPFFGFWRERYLLSPTKGCR